MLFVYVCPSWFIVVHSDSWWLLWTYLVYCGAICNHVRNVLFSMIQSLWFIFSHFFAMAFRVLERMTTSHNMTSPPGILLKPLFLPFTAFHHFHLLDLSGPKRNVTSPSPKVQTKNWYVYIDISHTAWISCIVISTSTTYFFFKSSLLVDC